MLCESEGLKYVRPPTRLPLNRNYIHPKEFPFTVSFIGSQSTSLILKKPSEIVPSFIQSFVNIFHLPEAVLQISSGSFETPPYPGA